MTYLDLLDELDTRADNIKKDKARLNQLLSMVNRAEANLNVHLYNEISQIREEYKNKRSEICAPWLKPNEEQLVNLRCLSAEYKKKIFEAKKKHSTDTLTYETAAESIKNILSIRAKTSKLMRQIHYESLEILHIQTVIAIYRGTPIEKVVGRNGIRKLKTTHIIDLLQKIAYYQH